MKENIISDLELILANIPDGLEPIEIVRWIYVKLGNIFSYDYNYVFDKDYNFGYDLSNAYLNRYETCVQISNILSTILNHIDENIKCEVVERHRDDIRGVYNHEHVGNIVTLSSGEKYFLDLTLDLFRIQSGCRTKEFGYSMVHGDEDIIPISDTDEIDKKLGLIKNNEYTDEKIKKIVDEIDSYDFSNCSFKEVLDYTFERLNSIMCSFVGHQEAKNYINMLFSKVMRCSYREFNLKYIDNKMISVFMFEKNGEEYWYVFDGLTGLIESSKEKLLNMLNDGWITRSNSLESLLQESKSL